MKRAFSSILFLLSTQVLALSPIRQICGNPSIDTLSSTKSVESLKEVICTQIKIGIPKEAIELSQNVLDILAKLNKDDDWIDQSEVLDSLGLYSDAIKMAKKDIPKTPMGFSIEKLQKSFSSLEARRLDPDSYYSSLKEIIGLTPQGPELINCFEKSSDKRIPNFKVSFSGLTEARTPGNDEGAYFDLSKDSSTKIITVDLRTDPIAMISMLAHEYKHSCISSKRYDCKIRCEQSLAGACEEEAREVLVDELVAHKTEAQIFYEVAKHSPNLVCNHTFMSYLYLRPMRVADFHILNEEGLEKGTFPLDIAENYIKLGNLLPDDIYESGNVSKFSEASKKKIHAAGFKLAE